MAFTDELKGKLKKVLDGTDLDEKIVSGVKGAVNKVEDFLDKTDLDEKITDGAKMLTQKRE